MESSETRLSRGTWFPVARYLQRLKQSGAKIAREEAIDVEGHRIVGHFQDVGNGPEYLKMNIGLLTVTTAYLKLKLSNNKNNKNNKNYYYYYYLIIFL